MATATSKAPSEVRILPFNLAAKIPSPATLDSAVATASRKVSGFSTTLQAGSSVEASSLALNAHPGVGALITVDPGGAADESFKVLSVTGSSAPFTCGLSHTAEYPHSLGATVSYEPGVSSRLLVATTLTQGSGLSGTMAFPISRNGADGQTYRVSVVGTLSNGEVIELEQDLVVSEIAPTETESVQVDEDRDLSFNYAAPLDLSGSSFSSAVAFASREETQSTTLAGAAAIGDTTILLHANPGIGALLTLNPTGPTQEKLKVSNITGSADPFTATVNPTPDFAHSDNESVSYEPGTSSRLLTSTTPSFLGQQAIVRKRRGVAGKTYRVTILATLANTEVIQHAGHVAVVEV